MAATIIIHVECTTAAHDEAKLSPTWWESQLPGGIQRFDGRPYLELRHCRKCGSTLAKKIDETTAPDPVEEVLA